MTSAKIFPVLLEKDAGLSVYFRRLLADVGTSMIQEAHLEPWMGRFRFNSTE